ncbi:MAG: hypothetical protein IJJ23_06055 [Clostridia bacterium]|nr:hypothetical protein [Clostridia bacterium]
MTRYYDTLPQAMRGYPTPSMPLDVSSKAAYERWAADARAALLNLLGFDRMRLCPPDGQRLECVQLDGYRREKWIVQTEPGIWASLYLLIPDGLQPGEKWPLVLCPHGHSGTKDATAGNACVPVLEKTITENRYDYGRQVVRMGMIALCPDARGHGERRERDMWSDDPEKRLNCSCHWLNHMAVPVGRCVTGMWVWDLMRLLDWALTLDAVDGSRVASIGLSGGGLQSLYFSALDSRVRFSVVSGYFYGFKEALLEMHNCACNYVPHLWEYFDVGEIGALVAPRPMVIETGDQDPLNGKSGLDNVLPYVEQVRSVYALYGNGDDFVHDIFHGPHRWNGEVSMQRLKAFMFGA